MNKFSPAPDARLRPSGPRRNANGRREITVGHLAGVKSLHNVNAASAAYPPANVGIAWQSGETGTNLRESVT